MTKIPKKRKAKERSGHRIGGLGRWAGSPSVDRKRWEGELRQISVRIRMSLSFFQNRTGLELGNYFSSVNQDRIICGLFAQIIWKPQQIMPALFESICGIIRGLFADYLLDYLQIICWNICRLFVGIFAEYLRWCVWFFRFLNVICYWRLFEVYLQIIFICRL